MPALNLIRFGLVSEQDVTSETVEWLVHEYIPLQIQLSTLDSYAQKWTEYVIHK